MLKRAWDSWWFGFAILGVFGLTLTVSTLWITSRTEASVSFFQNDEDISIPFEIPCGDADDVREIVVARDFSLLGPNSKGEFILYRNFYPTRIVLLQDDEGCLYSP